MPNTINVSPFDEQNTEDASGKANKKKKKKKKRYNPYGSGTANPENMQPGQP
jgi:hypothetical protein